MPLVKRVLIIRHGQSEWNAQGRWQGQADPPLTDLGEHQAHSAIETLSGFGIEALATSALERANRTGTIIASGLNLSTPLIDDRLNERSAGEWSGLTKVEIEEAWPGYLANRDRPPNYESDEALLPRITEGITQVAEALDGETLAIVAHGGVIYMLESSRGRPFERISNLGSLWLEVSPEQIVLGERVELIDESEATTPDQI